MTLVAGGSSFIFPRYQIKEGGSWIVIFSLPSENHITSSCETVFNA